MVSHPLVLARLAKSATFHIGSAHIKATKVEQISSHRIIMMRLLSGIKAFASCTTAPLWWHEIEPMSPRLIRTAPLLLGWYISHIRT